MSMEIRRYWIWSDWQEAGKQTRLHRVGSLRTRPAQNGVAVLQQFEEIPINVLSRDCDHNLIVKISAPTHRGLGGWWWWRSGPRSWGLERPRFYFGLDLSNIKFWSLFRYIAADRSGLQRSAAPNFSFFIHWDAVAPNESPRSASRRFHCRTNSPVGTLATSAIYCRTWASAVGSPPPHLKWPACGYELAASARSHRGSRDNRAYRNRIGTVKSNVGPGRFAGGGGNGAARWTVAMVAWSREAKPELLMTRVATTLPSRSIVNATVATPVSWCAWAAAG